MPWASFEPGGASAAMRRSAGECRYQRQLWAKQRKCSGTACLARLPRADKQRPFSHQQPRMLQTKDFALTRQLANRHKRDHTAPPLLRRPQRQLASCQRNPLQRGPLQGGGAQRRQQLRLPGRRAGPAPTAWRRRLLPGQGQARCSCRPGRCRSKLELLLMLRAWQLRIATSAAQGRLNGGAAVCAVCAGLPGWLVLRRLHERNQQRVVAARGVGSQQGQRRMSAAGEHKAAALPYESCSTHSTCGAVHPRRLAIPCRTLSCSARAPGAACTVVPAALPGSPPERQRLASGTILLGHVGAVRDPVGGRKIYRLHEQGGHEGED